MFFTFSLSTTQSDPRLRPQPVCPLILRVWTSWRGKTHHRCLVSSSAPQRLQQQVAQVHLDCPPASGHHPHLKVKVTSEDGQLELGLYIVSCVFTSWTRVQKTFWVWESFRERERDREMVWRVGLGDSVRQTTRTWLRVAALPTRPKKMAQHWIRHWTGVFSQGIDWW